MIWWSNICLSPTQCQHCFLEPALPFWCLCRTNHHSDRSENLKLQLPAYSQSQQMALRCTAGSWMWRQAMEKDEERKKVKDPDNRARQMTEAVSLKEGKTQSSFKSDVWSFSGSAFIKKKTCSYTKTEKASLHQEFKEKTLPRAISIYFSPLNTDVCCFWYSFHMQM